MDDYKELIKELRELSDIIDNSGCGAYGNDVTLASTLMYAANVIGTLERKLEYWVEEARRENEKFIRECERTHKLEELLAERDGKRI